MNTQRNNMKWASALVFISLLIVSTVSGQAVYQQQGATRLTIAGTSTMHDWTMTTDGASFNAQFETNEQGKPVRLATLEVSLPAESLKSGKSAMDKNAYTALKTDKYKKISFVMTNARMASGVIKCSGKLNIAGTTKDTEIEASYTVQADQSIRCIGSKKLLMTEYNVEPPSFMFGTVKTGDTITISFDLVLVPAKTAQLTLTK